MYNLTTYRFKRKVCTISQSPIKPAITRNTTQKEDCGCGENKNDGKCQNYDNDSEPFSVKTLDDVYNLNESQTSE